MKNEIKLLIAALVVILIVLVGAYALSGSGPQPSATPTVTPATGTPTTVPANGESTATATPVPSVAPTATPTFTPTPVPDNGVKQTEFGYWITYPPLGPQNWSSPKPPYAGNSVYFDHASDVVYKLFYVTADDESHYANVTLIRGGSTSGTTNVTIYIEPGSNLYWDPDQVDNLGGTLKFIDEDHFNVTFLPGESSKKIRVFWQYQVDSAIMADYNEEALMLHIVGVDPGYSIGGNDRYSYHLYYDVPVPVFGFVNPGGSWGIPTGGSIDLPLSLYRYYSQSGAPTVYFEVDTDLSPGANARFDPVTFDDGEQWHNGRLITDAIDTPGTYFITVHMVGVDYGSGQRSDLISSGDNTFTLTLNVYDE